MHRKSKSGIDSSFFKKRVEIDLYRLDGLPYLELFNSLSQSFDGKSDAVLFLIGNLNQPPEDIAVLAFQGLGKSLPPHEISQGHGG
jgi:hypothetical protein